MTYIELINDFWQEFEDEALKPNDALLYLYLLKVCNSKAWQNPFQLSNKKIRLCLEITDKAIIESRNRLSERGLISVIKGERNSTPPTYELLRLCFRTESKKGSKNASKGASKTESKKGSRSATNTQQNGSKTGNVIIDKDIDKEYYVVDEITREEFFLNFFSENRRKTIEALCMNNHTDEITLRRLAKEVLDDWQGTSEPTHSDINRAQKHLLNQIRIKLGAERMEQRKQEKTTNRPSMLNKAPDKAPRNVNDKWADFKMPTQ